MSRRYGERNTTKRGPPWPPLNLWSITYDLLHRRKLRRAPASGREKGPFRESQSRAAGATLPFLSRSLANRLPRLYGAVYTADIVLQG